MPDLDFMYTDDDTETATLAERDGGPARRSADKLLAELALKAALGRTGTRLLRRPGVALVVSCPDESWVEPLRNAAGSGWALAYGRTGSSKMEDKPSRGNDKVRERLAIGSCVLGVSQHPGLYLPSALILAADLTVTVTPPSPDLLAQVIKGATGHKPRRIDVDVRSLTYDEIVSQIRMGDSAATAVRRLAAACASKRTADPLVASAPPFEDLHGLGADFRQFGLDLIHAAEKFRAGTPPLQLPRRHAILASEPGLGKTSSVRSLARSAGLNFVSTSVAQWFSTNNGYLDGVIKACNAALDEALENSPSLLFLDECDAIPSRQGLDADRASWWVPLITNLLLRVEQIAQHPTAFVAMIGASNHAERLDPALVRPGRLDRIIHIERPDNEALAGIVRQHLAGDLAGEDVRIVAELGTGATGATAAGWVSRARGRAASSRRPLALADLLAEVAPPETRSPAILRRVCVHEAGHATALVRLTGRVHSVSVVETRTQGGHIVHEQGADTVPDRNTIERMVVALLAGRAAEEVVCGSVSAGAGGSADSDLAQATRYVTELHGSLGMRGSLIWRGPGDRLVDFLRLDPLLARDVEDDLQRLWASSVALIKDNRHAVEAVADLLARERVVSGARIEALIADLPPAAAPETPR